MIIRHFHRWSNIELKIVRTVCVNGPRPVIALDIGFPDDNGVTIGIDNTLTLLRDLVSVMISSIATAPTRDSINEFFVLIEPGFTPV